MIADELDLNKTVIYKFVTEDLNMIKLSVKIVPKFLSPEYMAQRVKY